MAMTVNGAKEGFRQVTLAFRLDIRQDTGSMKKWGILAGGMGVWILAVSSGAQVSPDSTDEPLPTFSSTPPTDTNTVTTPPVPSNLSGTSTLGPIAIHPADTTAVEQPEGEKAPTLITPSPIPAVTTNQVVAPTEITPESTNMTPINPAPIPSVPEGDVRSIPLSAGAVFRDQWVCQAIPSSENWSRSWNAPDFGRVHVSAALRDLPLPDGVDLPWQNDATGVPEVILTAVLHFPRIPSKEGASVTAETPDAPLVNQETVTIKQYVTFYHPPGDSWFASASPYYALLGEGADAKVILPVSTGEGGWTARLGSGGLLVRHFVEGGLEAARRPIEENFRDEEIRLFLQGHSDVIFYIRPQKT
jgi:hypothetical protein